MGERVHRTDFQAGDVVAFRLFTRQCVVERVDVVSGHVGAERPGVEFEAGSSVVGVATIPDGGFSAVAAGAGASGFVGDGEHASRNLDDLLGDLGSDDEARVVVTTRDQVANVRVDAVGNVHVDGAGVPKLLEFLPALVLELVGFGVGQLVCGGAFVKPFECLRVAERAVRVGVPVDDGTVLEFALAQADEMVDRVRRLFGGEVDEVRVDAVADRADGHGAHGHLVAVITQPEFESACPEHLDQTAVQVHVPVELAGGLVVGAFVGDGEQALQSRTADERAHDDGNRAGQGEVIVVPVRFDDLRSEHSMPVAAMPCDGGQASVHVDIRVVDDAAVLGAVDHDAAPRLERGVFDLQVEVVLPATEREVERV